MACVVGWGGGELEGVEYFIHFENLVILENLVLREHKVRCKEKGWE
jgi:hypothetical protein